MRDALVSLTLSSRPSCGVADFWQHLGGSIDIVSGVFRDMVHGATRCRNSGPWPNIPILRHLAYKCVLLRTSSRPEAGRGVVYTVTWRNTSPSKDMILIPSYGTKHLIDNLFACVLS